ncbi:hypothetical protein N7535_006338 [Penicillium sp. DV-2018c]|nr:hypothetical protein N7535_006338 [Penicillium sp. DV-2018c]
MMYLSDPSAVLVAQAAARQLDSDQLFEILACEESTGPIDRTLEVGERPHAENAPVYNMGNLSRLVPDVLWEIVEHLDFASAINLSLANRSAHELVDNSSVTFLKKWSPDMPKVLADARTIRCWSIWQLKCVLRTTRYVSCGDLTTRIFIATMERCCMACMQFNAVYRCLTKTQTTAAFALTLEELDKIQPIFSVGQWDEYSQAFPRVNFPTHLDRSWHDPSRRKAPGCWVWPIKHTLARALRVYGSREAMRAAAEKLCAGPQDPRFADMSRAHFYASWYDYVRAAPLEPLTWDQANSGEFVRRRSSHRIVTQFVLFAPLVPCVETQVVTFRCLGCLGFLRHLEASTLKDQEKGWLKIGQSRTMNEADTELYRRAHRGRTADELIQHGRDECLGGWFLVYERMLKNSDGQVPM